MAVGLGVALVYVSILPARLSSANYGADGGDFLAALLTGGVPHPTGYPTYMLIGRLALVLLPGIAPVTVMAGVSAAAAALTAGLLCAWGARRNWLWGLGSALAWAGAPLVFSQAVIVEVHTLQGLFVLATAAWVLTLAGGVAGWSAARLSALAFICGLGMGNHLLLGLMLPAIMAALWSAWRAGLSWRKIWMQSAAFAVGLSVYGFIPIWAARNPPVSWGDAQSWDGLVWLVSGSIYQANLALPDMNRVGWLLGQVGQGFGVVGLIPAAVGLTTAGLLSEVEKRLGIYIFVVYALFSLGYNTRDAQLYLLPGCLVMAALAGKGLYHLVKWRWGQVWVALALIALLISLGLTGSQVSPRAQDNLARCAENILTQAPPSAIILTQADEDTFSMWYARFGLQTRPDVVVISLPLTQFQWYQRVVQRTFPDLNAPSERDDGSASWGEALVDLNPQRVVLRCHAEPDSINGCTCVR